MIKRLLLLDNNCLNPLGSPGKRDRLRANIKAAGWEFWPTGANVLEAVTTSDPAKRKKLLETLHGLSGTNHSLPLPTGALEAVARSFAAGTTQVTFGEPRLTHIFRDPEDVSDESITSARDFLAAQEAGFAAAHERARAEIRPVLMERGGRNRWSSVGAFLDEVWSVPSHLDDYIKSLWDHWGLPGEAPVEKLLKNELWRLYFDGWGAATYARLLEHPQKGLVQGHDLSQLVYMGAAPIRVLVTEDRAFRNLANSILRERYCLAQVVPLDDMLS